MIELERGDLFFFTDHLLNHSNEKAIGIRHSVVAFMEDRVWTWMQEAYKFMDYRVDKDKKHQKRFRQHRKLESGNGKSKRQKVSSF